MSGMRIKRSWIFNAVGQVALFCVSVAGLTKAELPKEKTPSGLLVLGIEGLCIGGHSLVPMGNAQLPHGDWIEEGTPIPQSMMAVSWSDGDNAQIKMLVEESTLAQLG
eukprot:scaffold154393_cov54-Attheya_sp.AAC.7